MLTLNTLNNLNSNAKIDNCSSHTFNECVSYGAVGFALPLLILQKEKIFQLAPFHPEAAMALHREALHLVNKVSGYSGDGCLSHKCFAVSCLSLVMKYQPA